MQSASSVIVVPTVVNVQSVVAFTGEMIVVNKARTNNEEVIPAITLFCNIALNETMKSD
ncbi:MAG: hypothetical protein ACRD5H_07530 [Nitrososphaerales archaeon]